MKWINHKLLTGSLIFSLTGNVIMTMIAVIGSIIPDVIEGFPEEGNLDYWRRQHRQFSHWFVPYLITFLLCYAFAIYHGYRSITFEDLTILIVSDNPYYRLIIGPLLISFLALGACCHIIEDAFCGKIPGVDPKERIGIKAFNVGSIKEFALTLTLSFILVSMRLI